MPQRHQCGDCTVESSNHVCKCERWQHRRSVGKSIHRCKSGTGFNQATKARHRSIRATLPPTRYTDNNQLGIYRMEHFGAQFPLLQGSRQEIFNQHLGCLDQIQQDSASPFRTHIDGYTFLVPCVNLPVNTDTFHTPVAQVISLAWSLNLDNFSAKIGQYVGECITGNQTG